MCGIFGYIGAIPAFKAIVDGLLKLEYRGYDSWGVVTIADKKFEYIKRKGGVENYNTNNFSLPGKIGIGHVRWATKGDVSIANAHPHFDCKNKIAVVHNGVILNEPKIREVLSKNGHFFSSDTDSELFAHLLEEKSNISFIDAIHKTLKEIDGQYAFAILNLKEPGKMYAAKNKSPLKVGISNKGYYLTSDTISLPKTVTEYIDLEDGDIVEITFGGFKIFNKDIKKIERRITKIKSSNFEHSNISPPYFIKEVIQQKNVTARIIENYVKNNNVELGIGMAHISKFDEIVLTGAGSSYFASIIGEHYLRRITKLKHVQSVVSSEIEYKYATVPKNSLLIALSQSGETRDTLDAIRFFRNRGSCVLAFVNRSDAEISRISDYSVNYFAGPEKSVLASKTFTSEILMMLLFSIQLAMERKIPIKNSIIEEIKNLPIYINEVFLQKSEIRHLAMKYSGVKGVYPLSSGIQIPIALEIGRKFEEGLYLPAVGTSLGNAAELKHGPLTMVHKKLLIFIIPTIDRKKILTNIGEAKSRGAYILAVLDQGDKMAMDMVDDSIYIPKIRNEIANELLSPILYVIPLQLFVYYMAKEKGKEKSLDRPRNLAKSVTV